MTAGSIERDASQAEPRHLLRAVVLWIVMSVLGIIFVTFAVPLILPTTASSTARFANQTIIVFTILSVPVAFFVWVFLGYSLVVFRVRERPTVDGPRLQPTMLAQIGWLSITGALCLFLLVWGLVGMYEQTAAATSPSPLNVKVTAQQWTWTYTYPGYGFTSHVLELPVGRSVRFQVQSLDVLHGFSIDPLGVRMDANPEQPITLPLVTPSHLGTFDTRCVEFCGLYHSYMYSQVRIVPTKQFDAWVKQEKQGVAT